MNANKLPKKTDFDNLNDLITWYEKNKPEAGKRIPVRASRETIAKWLNYPTHKKLPNEFEYRDRVIYPEATPTSAGEQ